MLDAEIREALNRDFFTIEQDIATIRAEIMACTFEQLMQRFVDFERKVVEIRVVLERMRRS